MYVYVYTQVSRVLVHIYTGLSFRLLANVSLASSARGGWREMRSLFFFPSREEKKMQPKKGNILTFVWKKKKMKRKEMIIESWISGYGLGMGWGSFEYRYSENCKFYAVSLVQYIHTYIYIFAKYLSFTSFRWLSKFNYQNSLKIFENVTFLKIFA